MSQSMSTTQHVLSSNQRYGSVALISSAAFLALLAADMVLPMLPQMALQMHASAHWAQLSIAVFFLGLAFSRLILVSMSDAWGRRPVILLGIAVIVLGGFLSAFAHHMAWLIVGRLLTGIGAAGSVGMVGVVTGDCFQGKDMIASLSFASVLVFVAPAIAPLLGAVVGLHWGWRGIYELITLYHLLLWLVMWRLLPETLQQKTQDDLFNHFQTHMMACLRHRPFMVYTFVNTAIFAVYCVYLTASPFLFQWHFHFSVQQFTILTTVLVGSQLLARVLNVWLLSWMSVAQLTSTCLTLMLVAACGLVLQVCFGPSPIVLAAWIMLFITPGAMLSPVLFTRAMEAHRHAMGVGSALHGSIKMLGAFVGSFLAATAAHQPLAVISWGFFLVALSSVLALRSLQRFPKYGETAEQNLS